MLGTTLVIVNPAARSGKAAQIAAQAASVLENIKASSPRGLEKYAFHYTVAPLDATRFISNEGAHYRTIITIGGDGIVNEVINGLMAIPSEHRPRLCVIPCGNGDDFARTLSLPRNPTKALQLLSSHALTPKRIDLGKANNHWFVETLSFGLDAAIALETQELRKKTNRTGTSLYVQCGFDQLKNHRDIHKVRVTLDNHPTQTISCYLLAIQNGQSYGGGFKVCPQAQINDGFLDICYVEPHLSFAAATKLFIKAKEGKHVRHPHVKFLKAKKIILEFDQFLSAQIDGELFTDNKVTIEVFPGEIEVLMP